MNRHDFAPMDSAGLAVLHWHNDVVSAPEGATVIAKSDVTKVQAFAYGSALGLQYHLEVSPTILEQWLEQPEMIKGLKKSQIKKIREDFRENEATLHRVADTVFFLVRGSLRKVFARSAGERLIIFRLEILFVPVQDIGLENVSLDFATKPFSVM